MKTIEISANKRKDLGKRSTRELRKNEQVPCVMYGGSEVIHFYTHENNFRNLIYTPEIYLVLLDLDGDKRKAIMQDIQFHPVSDALLHIDFVEVLDDKPVIVNLPIQLTGSSIGVKNGGKTRQRRRVLKVKGLVEHLPEHLDVDITNVDIGDVVKIGDLQYENLEILDPLRSMIFSVVSSRVAMKGMEIIEVVEEEVEGEEGEEEGADQEGDEKEESAEAPAEGKSESEGK